MSRSNRFLFFTCVLSMLFGLQAFAEERSPTSISQSTKHDVSPTLSELISIYEQKQAAGISPNVAPDFVIPNILDIEEPLADKLPEAPAIREQGVRGTNANASPPVSVSALGYSTQDNLDQNLGNFIPPDTNGDVGLDFYVQYVNVGWAVFNKSDGSLASGPFVGNVFWQGFGGPCENDNAGDPIVLFDKLAQRWVFSQFTSSANTDGRQCFAISETSDPLGPYDRYEFVFEGVFNDYPHIGIWTDETGDRSGYYFVTHDFSDVGGPNQAFEQASYAVAERDAMLAGADAADTGFVRFTDTTFLGFNNFGALPPHLESIQVPSAGACAPFVTGRPDLSGYFLIDLCVDWDNAANSTLTNARVVDAGETWAPGPGGIVQADGNAAAALGTLAGFGRILYRASYRANAPTSGIPDSYVISFPVDVGAGQAGVRWAQINFPNIEEVFLGGFEEGELGFASIGGSVANQGEYAPDSTVDRWMSGISVDRDGNIGLAYTASSIDENIFPGVRYTTRKFDDPVNTLREEEICVDGGGVQTDTLGRWGDYSSTSVDPVDECTFWSSVEYQLTTAGRNWSNRICSYRFDDCGEPAAFFNNDVQATANICAVGSSSVGFDYNLIALNGLSETINFSLDTLPAGLSGVLSMPSTSGFPATGRITLQGTDGLATGIFPVTLNASSTTVDASITYNLNVSDSTVAVASTLTAPVNNATSVDLLPTFNWSAAAGALNYRLEVATDINFDDIVFSVTTEGTSFASDISLDTNTLFFWRVTALNNCGDGAVSVVSSFTTGSFVTGTPADCPAGTTANTVFFDDIEGDVSDWSQPADPTPTGANTWQTSTARSFSGSSWFAVDSDVSSDQYLVSPAIVLPAASEAPISLAFWNFQSMEANAGTGTTACWDGGLLEVSTDGGASFTQIAGADILRDQYNGNVTNNPNSPISDLEAWCANAAVEASGPLVDIPVVSLDSLAGQTVQFRFRLGTDANTGDEGWYVDNVTVQSCQ